MKTWLPPNWSKRLLTLVMLLVLSCSLAIACSEESPIVYPNATALRLWWNRGYFPEETEAIQRATTSWQRKRGMEVSLLSYSEKDLTRYLQSITKVPFPDAVYNYLGDWMLYPQYAWQNKLTDVSDVVEPLKDLLTPIALAATRYSNQTIQNRSEYGVPFGQHSIYIHYWQDLLQEAGYTQQDIPSQWTNFWQFWQTVQQKLHEKGKKEIYGLGISNSQYRNSTSVGRNV